MWIVSIILEGFKAYSAKQLFGWIYKKQIRNFAAMTDIEEKKRKNLRGIFNFSDFKLLKSEKSKDGTEKFLFKLADSETIETVLIPEKKRNTLCLSTQVGCRFNCEFCASKEGGFVRNLSSSEIINQYLELSARNKITNIVFMGIGEPLDNFENTVKSIKILTEPAGVNFTKRRVSLSTCGLAGQIKKLARQGLGVKLSVSLHAATDQKRSRLMPINRKYPLADLSKAIHYYRQKSKFPVTFEYILIDGFNTGQKDVLQLAKLVKASGAKLNLIPYNLGKENKFSLKNEVKLVSAKIEKINIFKQKLKEEKITFTLRKSRGSDINAACGQLRSLSSK